MGLGDGGDVRYPATRTTDNGGGVIRSLARDMSPRVAHRMLLHRKNLPPTRHEPGVWNSTEVTGERQATAVHVLLVVADGGMESVHLQSGVRAPPTCGERQQQGTGAPSTASTAPFPPKQLPSLSSRDDHVAIPMGAHLPISHYGRPILGLRRPSHGSPRAKTTRASAIGSRLCHLLIPLPEVPNIPRQSARISLYSPTTRFSRRAMQIVLRPPTKPFSVVSRVRGTTPVAAHT